MKGAFWTVVEWLRRANPLIILNGYLLKSWPSLWRSRLIHVLWWAAVATSALYLVGFIVPAGIEDIPATQTLDIYAILIWQLIAVPMGYWLVVTWRTPLPSLRLPVLSATLLFYLVCIYAVTVIPTSLNKVLVSRIGAAHMIADLEKDYAALARYNFGQCFTSNSPDETLTQTFTEIPRNYGLFDPDFDCVDEKTCPSDRNRCVQLKNSGGTNVKLNYLREMIMFLRVASERVSGKIEKKEHKVHPQLHQIRLSIASKLSLVNGERLLICLLAALMLLLIHISNAPSVPTEAQASSGALKFLPKPSMFLTQRVRRLDHFLLKEYPNWWSTRIHTLLPYNIFMFAFLSLFYVATMIIGFYLGIFGSDGEVWISIILIIFLFSWPLISSYLQFSPVSNLTELNNHVYFVVSFFASFASVVLLLYALGALLIVTGDGYLDSFGLLFVTVCVVLSFVIFTVGIGRYINLVFGNKYLVFYIVSCIVLDFISIYLAVDGTYPLVFLSILIFVLTCAICSFRSINQVIYKIAFSLYSSMMILVSVLIFSILFWNIGIPSSAPDSLIILMPAVVIVPTFLVVLITCYATYRVSYRIYMSPRAD